MEREVIVISTTVTRASTFTGDAHRVNVAMTRARRHMMLIGCAAAMQVSLHACIWGSPSSQGYAGAIECWFCRQLRALPPMVPAQLHPWSHFLRASLGPANLQAMSPAFSALLAVCRALPGAYHKSLSSLLRQIHPLPTACQDWPDTDSEDRC